MLCFVLVLWFKWKDWQDKISFYDSKCYNWVVTFYSPSDTVAKFLWQAGTPDLRRDSSRMWREIFLKTWGDPVIVKTLWMWAFVSFLLPSYPGRKWAEARPHMRCPQCSCPLTPARLSLSPHRDQRQTLYEEFYLKRANNALLFLSSSRYLLMPLSHTGNCSPLIL